MLQRENHPRGSRAPRHPSERCFKRSWTEPAALPRAGLLHYQFETIHPFLDGNGRAGRLLIGLFLHSVGRLSQPLLYLSGYLEAHRSEYYDRLQAVREHGDLDGWLVFFLTAVARQSADTVYRARQLLMLRERLRGEAAGHRSHLGQLGDLLFISPYVTTTSVAVALDLSDGGARNLITTAGQRGWLTRRSKVGRGGRQVWAATDVLEILLDPPTYSTHTSA